MLVKRLRTSKHITKNYLIDGAIIFLLLGITLISWVPYFLEGLSRSFISFPSFGQDQMHYVARAHSIWQGKSPQDAFVLTNTGLEDGLGNFAEYLLFLPGRLLFSKQLDFVLYFYMVIIFSSLISLASAHYFFRFLTSSRLKAVSLTITFIFGSQFIDSNGIYFPGMPLFNRWPTPMLHYFLLFILFRVLIDTEFRNRKIIGSIVFALSFYIYFYSWQIIIALSCAAVILNILQRNSKEVKEISVIIGTGVFLASPIIFRLISLLMTEDEDSLLEFAFRLQESRVPTLNTMNALILVFMLTVLKMRHKFSLKAIKFVILCAATATAISNQQVLTGKLLQPGHFHWYFVAPAFFSCAVLLLTSRLKARIPLTVLPGVLLFILSINQFQIYSIAESEAKVQSEHSLSKSQLSSLSGAVFTQSSSVLDQLVTSYEHDVYWHPFGIYYKGSTDIASEAVAFMAVWMGSESPIEISSLNIGCSEYYTDPCSTLRMLIGSKSEKDWWTYLKEGSPVNETLLDYESALIENLDLATVDKKQFFDHVVSRGKIQTIITTEPATLEQKKLMGTGWKLVNSDGRFWIYRSTLV